MSYFPPETPRTPDSLILILMLGGSVGLVLSLTWWALS